MPKYDYQARTRAAILESGTIEAPNRDEAISILQTRDLLVTSVQEHRNAPTRIGHGKIKMHRGANSADMVVLARALSAMTEAGLPLLRALETVNSQVRSQRLFTALTQIAQDIRSGLTFRDALAKHPSIFSSFWISLIETGEASGQLTRSLEQIAAHLEKSGAIQRKIVSALIYPILLLGVAGVAVLVFTLKIIPTFGSMFASFGAQLPLLTRMVLAFSNGLRKYFLIFLGGAGALVFSLVNYIKTKPGRWQFDKLCLSLPIFGPGP